MKFLLVFFVSIICSGEGQEPRLFFRRRAFITVSRYAHLSITTTLQPVCFEVVEPLNECGRKKRQDGFLVDPAEEKHDIFPSPVTTIQPTAGPEFRYSPLLHNAINNVQASFRGTPSLQASVKERPEAYGRWFLKLLSVRTSTTTRLFTTIATDTQTIKLECTAPGEPVPENTCDVSIVFPRVPDGTSLQEYCQSIGDVAQMAILQCRYAGNRKRSVDNRPVVIRFGQKADGRIPSRSLVSRNILNFCKYKQMCTFPAGFEIDLALVGVRGFSSILSAGGESLTFANDDKDDEEDNEEDDDEEDDEEDDGDDKVAFKNTEVDGSGDSDKFDGSGDSDKVDGSGDYEKFRGSGETDEINESGKNDNGDERDERDEILSNNPNILNS
ncbi:uncharacterized protein LOC136033173 [Artemia franciscana]|uniref:Uncharacterized protein n=1 Tax=Artemia franciscana TaxID=6661 RepID=A0AA88IBZ9_ARTSF|nr:hypothetical protein QYM36_001647 [Artemia franciscana]